MLTILSKRLAAQLAVIAQLDARKRRDAGRCDAPLRLVALRTAQRDTERLRPELRRPDDQCTPTAADVEQTFAGTQSQLA